MLKKIYENPTGPYHTNFWTPERYGFDLGINECGHEICIPFHYWQGTRDVYVLHYILNGEGTLLWKGQEYHLKKHMGFLVSPDVECKWTADKDNPWEYRWVAFSGEKAWQIMALCSVNADNPIFEYNTSSFIPDRMKQIYESSQIPYVANFQMTGYLNLLLAEFIKRFPISNINQQDLTVQHVNNALTYIQLHYKEDITVEKIAKIIGINRSHLYKLFIKYTNTSPLEHIQNLRLGHACDMLKNSNLSISKVAFSCGFSDAYYFSRLFKEKNNMSPTEYRDNHQPTTE